MPENLPLFGPKETPPAAKTRSPLADRLRPTEWEGFELAAPLDPAFLEQLRTGRGTPPSMIVWGPPGSGKTTFARLVGRSFECRFVQLSAVLDGVKEVREIVAQATKSTLRTLLFVDEIHRFNKAQQDAFLPHIENGTIILVGATTENPSFSLTQALLSRVRVITLEPLREDALRRILAHAEGDLSVTFEDRARDLLVQFGAGDARRLLNAVESLVESRRESRAFDEVEVATFLRKSGAAVYDRSGEAHYDYASAFIKSMRGSDPHAALYWGFRMLKSGEDPRFLFRRLIIFASEDIGNADPRALELAVAAASAFERVGLPEGRIPLAQCITYLACAPKSNRSYAAMHRVLSAIDQHDRVTVPLHLRNAPTELMRSLGYGEEYLYPHDQPGAFAQGVEYLPPEVSGQTFYEPSDRGYERKIAELMIERKRMRIPKGS